MKNRLVTAALLLVSTSAFAAESINKYDVVDAAASTIMSQVRNGYVVLGNEIDIYECRNDNNVKINPEMKNLRMTCNGSEAEIELTFDIVSYELTNAKPSLGGNKQYAADGTTQVWGIDYSFDGTQTIKVVANVKATKIGKFDRAAKIAQIKKQLGITD